MSELKRQVTTSSSVDWWIKPRTVAVVVDNPSWVLPYAQKLVDSAIADGDHASLVRSYDDIPIGSIAFLLGCTGIAPPEILTRNRVTLVVHASRLPEGRGFSPLTWMVLEGHNEIPGCLLHAASEIDSGTVVYRDKLVFDGHELVDELRNALGNRSIELCRRFLSEPSPPKGETQSGKPTYYGRRSPKDSALDPEKSLAEQFNLLRTVDNSRYPAFFDLKGHRYEIHIRKKGRVQRS